MIATILDFETTGLDRKEDRIVEIGALSFDTSDYRIVDVYSTLVKPEKPISKEAQKVTGLKTEDIESFGGRDSATLLFLAKKLVNTDIVLAHNAEFDRAFYEQYYPEPHEGVVLKWVDTLTALPLGNTVKSQSLQALLQHFNVNPIAPHRAIFDCISLYEIIRMFRWEVIQERIDSPDITLIADLPYEEFEKLPNEEKPKAFGFKWQAEPKQWTLKCKKIDLDGVQFPFRYQTQLL